MSRIQIFVVVTAAMLCMTGNSVAGLIAFEAHLDGPSESPPNASPGIGFAIVGFDDAAHELRVQVTFSGLLGTTTASHIHGPTASPDFGNAPVITQVPTFIGFPLGVTSGSYDSLFDTLNPATYNPAFVSAHGGAAGAEAALGASLLEGRAYLNIHTTSFPGGEIRGFLHAVPEPGSLVLFGTGAAALIAWRRRSRTKQDRDELAAGR
jgi:hypothetical protein